MRIVMIVSWLGDDCTSCGAGNEVVSVPFFCHQVNPNLGGPGLVSNCATFGYGIKGRQSKINK